MKNTRCFFDTGGFAIHNTEVFNCLKEKKEGR